MEMDMMIRGHRISQWSRPQDIEKLVRRLFPGAHVRVQSSGRCRRIYLLGGALYDDIRALADEIEASVPAKAAVSFEVECLE
jgi:hypothetical protein